MSKSSHIKQLYLRDKDIKHKDIANEYYDSFYNISNPILIFCRIKRYGVYKMYLNVHLYIVYTNKIHDINYCKRIILHE